MEAIKEKTVLEKLTLALAAVLTLVQLAVLMDCFTLTNLLWLLAAGALTWLLLRGGKEEYFWYAFLGVGAAALIGFFAGFSRELYAIVTVRGEYRNTAENFFTVLPGLLVLAGALGVTALGGLLFASKFPAIGDRLRRLWYLPALLFAVTLLYALCLGLFVTLYGYGSRWAGFSEFASLRTLLWGGFAFCLGLRAAGHEELPTRAAPGDAEGGAPAVKYCSAAKLLFRRRSRGEILLRGEAAVSDPHHPRHLDAGLDLPHDRRPVPLRGQAPPQALARGDLLPAAAVLCGLLAVSERAARRPRRRRGGGPALFHAVPGPGRAADADRHAAGAG